MRSKFFACVLKVVGVPLVLIKWILKSIWFVTYGFVGLLYKVNFINGSKAGKIAYTVASTTLLVGIVLIVYFIKK